MTKEKALAVIANAEKIKKFNAAIEQNYPHDNRKDYPYTSVAAAERFLASLK